MRREDSLTVKADVSTLSILGNATIVVRISQLPVKEVVITLNGSSTALELVILKSCLITFAMGSVCQLRFCAMELV